MMQCSCIANDNFNFIIEYKKDHLLLIDKSEWITSQYNTKLDTIPLKIINGPREKIVQMRVGGTTLINYCDLPSDNGCGNDGIYEFQVETCGQVFTRCDVVLIHIMCSYSKLLLQYTPEEYNDKVWPILREIEFIKANSRICNVTKATDHYMILKRMFEHINCKC